MKRPIIRTRVTVFKLLAIAAAMAFSYVAGALTPHAWTQSAKTDLPFPYIQVDYMKVEPGKLQAYLSIEQRWRPVHEELIRTGKKKAWALYGRAFAGANDEYNYLTLNIFDAFEQMENQYPPDIFEKVHTDQNPADIDRQTAEARTQVRSDVWILIDEVGLSPESGDMTRK
jgi:hypothetical protein